MATIRSAIQLYDNMSPALRPMNKALNVVLNSFEAMQSASSNSVDTSAIRQARDELARTEVIFDEIEQEIRQADQAQQNFNNSVRNGGNAADGLSSKLRSLAVTLGAAFSAKKVIELADTMTQTTARLDLMNDGLQTTEQLQNKIMESANRSRASYQTTADAVSKMGIMARDAFSSSDELIAFTEQINKQFTIAGTSAQGIDAAMLQLTQAMASGVLRGEELNSVFEQAPTIIQSIAEYLDVPIGSIRAMAAEGQITAEIVKNAMFATADETNRKFAEMPMTFSQVWTVLQNSLLQTFQPLIQAIGAAAQFIYDNWSTIAPVFWGLAAAAGAYAAGLGIVAVAHWIANGSAKALFTTLLSNPLFWIALAIGVVIGMIYKWVQSVGGIKVAWLIAVNAIMTAWDWVKIGFFTGVYWVIGLWEKMLLAFRTVSVGISNFMGDLKANVLMILQNMVNGAIDIINGFISILNKLPGVSIEAIAGVTFGTTAQLENEAAKNARNSDLEKYRAELEANAASRDASLDQMKSDARAATAARDAEISSARVAAAAEDSSSAFGLGSTLDGIYGNTGDTAGNTASMADSMNSLEDSLEYLVDIAEREAINRFTTAEITIEQTNNNNISSDMDIDGVMEKWNSDFTEILETAAEGVHE
jgi:tape measure domain-containing protein